MLRTTKCQVFFLYFIENLHYYFYTWLVFFTYNYTNCISFCYFKTKNEMNNRVFYNVYSGLIIFKVLKN